MTTDKQTTLDWDSVDNPTMLSVKDVREGQTVKPIKGQTGAIVDVQTATYKNNNDEPEDVQVYVLNCKLDDRVERLRVNKTVLWRLKEWREGKDENLLSKTFKIVFKGSGKYQAIDLVLSGAS